MINTARAHMKGNLFKRNLQEPPQQDKHVRHRADTCPSFLFLKTRFPQSSAYARGEGGLRGAEKWETEMAGA